MDGDEDLTCTAEEDIELCTATAHKIWFEPEYHRPAPAVLGQCGGIRHR